MKFSKKKFYEAYKQEFGAIQPHQTEGLDRLLDGFERYYGWWDAIYKCANALAQVYHETAHSFMPVVEGYYLAKGVQKDKRYFQGDYQVVKNFQRGLSYYPYFGIGDIQLTHKYNYQKYEKLVRQYFPELVAEFEARTGKTFDLDGDPSQMLDGWISFAVLTLGLNKDPFRGNKTLAGYVVNGVPDYAAMRGIVNGDRNYPYGDSGLTIGEATQRNSKKFEKMLRFAQLSLAEEVQRKGSILGLTDSEINDSVSAISENKVTPDQTGKRPSEPVQSADTAIPATDQVSPTPPQQPAVAPPEMPVPVQQVKPETETPKEVTGIKAYWAAISTFAIANVAAIWQWLAGSDIKIVAGLIGLGLVTGIVWMVSRYLYINAKEKREHQLTREREQRAFELQKLTLESAMRKDLNTVQIVPQPIQNAESN